MKASILALGLGLSVLAGAGAASAQSNITELANLYARPGEFFLSDNEPREVVRYSKPRDLVFCLTYNDQTRDFPVKVKWEAYEATVYPGNCLFFDAKEVTVRTAKPLPQGVMIRGRLETDRS